mmetsp:Transcript_55494/g.136116  ORF Transcript_55494/g.136116 Transcript_55494/m.136116 type:complete len:294 (+) Transcript_55494:572-1453(+)
MVTMTSTTMSDTMTHVSLPSLVSSKILSTFEMALRMRLCVSSTSSWNSSSIFDCASISWLMVRPIWPSVPTVACSSVRSASCSANACSCCFFSAPMYSSLSASIAALIFACRSAARCLAFALPLALDSVFRSSAASFAFVSALFSVLLISAIVALVSCTNCLRRASSSSPTSNLARFFSTICTVSSRSPRSHWMLFRIVFISFCVQRNSSLLAVLVVLSSVVHRANSSLTPRTLEIISSRATKYGSWLPAIVRPRMVRLVGAGRRRGAANAQPLRSRRLVGPGSKSPGGQNVE